MNHRILTANQSQVSLIESVNILIGVFFTAAENDMG